MPTNPDPDWGPKALAEMDAAHAELMRVAAEVRAVPGIIANANARLKRCLEEDRRLDRERAARTRRRQRRLRRDVREEKRRRERAERKGRTMPKTAEDYAREAMSEIVEAGAKVCLAQTKEPTRRCVIECAQTYLGELVHFAKVYDDDGFIEAIQDAK